jgi:hypothetical protein
MALSNGAHVEIDGISFMLAEQIGQRDSSFYRGHYNYQLSSLLANRSDISGKPGRQNLVPEILLWAYDDFSGGEGNKFYDPGATTKYYRSDSGDPRNAGFLTGTPTRTETTITSSTPGVSAPGLQTAPVFASGGGNLWMINSNTVAPATTPIIWNMNASFQWDGATLSAGSSGTPSWGRQLAVDGFGNAYAVLGNPTTINRIERVHPDLTSELFHDETANPTGSLVGAWGAAVWEKYLYVWTGFNLYQWDTTAVIPVTPTQVDGLGAERAASIEIVADVCNAGDRVAMFISSPGDTRVYQYARTQSGSTTPAFSQIWVAPGNFQAYSIAYLNGVVYLGGQQDGVTTLWGVRLTDYVPFLATQIRPDGT